jgi:hypothetical protein
MTETLGIPPYEFLQTRQWFARHSSVLAKNPSLWDTPMSEKPPAQFLNWSLLAIRNKPAPVFYLPQPNSVTFGDACRLGYAGITCYFPDGVDGACQTTLTQRRWDNATLRFLDVKHSTVSEPEAAKRLILRLPACHRSLYVTDHQPFIDGHDRGYSLSPHYNSCITKLAKERPATQLTFQAGEEMLADLYSRFELTTLLDAHRQQAESLARTMLRQRGEGSRCVGVGRARAQMC